MKPQQVTNLIILASVLIVWMLVKPSTIDKQLAQDVKQMPVVLFNMSEEERDYNLQVDAVSNDTIFVSPKEIK
jgi:hypothetical protein